MLQHHQLKLKSTLGPTSLTYPNSPGLSVARYRSEPILSVFLKLFFKTLFVPRIKEGLLSVPSFHFMYNIWQDAGIRIRVALTAVRCVTNERNTSLMIYTHPAMLRDEGRRMRYV